MLPSLQLIVTGTAELPTSEWRVELGDLSPDPHAGDGVIIQVDVEFTASRSAPTTQVLQRSWTVAKAPDSISIVCRGADIVRIANFNDG